MLGFISILGVVLVVIAVTLICGGRIIMTALDDLKTSVANLDAKVQLIDADVKKLIANSTSGPGPGQLVVNASDLTALKQTVDTDAATLVADDAAANPPAPAPAPTPTPTPGT